MTSINLLLQLFYKHEDCLKDILCKWDSCHDLESVKKEIMKEYRIKAFDAEWKNRGAKMLLSESLDLEEFYNAFKATSNRYIVAVLGKEIIHSAERFLSNIDMLSCFAGVLWCLRGAEELPGKLSSNKLNNLLFTLGNWLVQNGYPVNIHTSEAPDTEARIIFYVYRDIGRYYLYGEMSDDNIKQHYRFGA